MDRRTTARRKRTLRDLRSRSAHAQLGQGNQGRTKHAVSAIRRKATGLLIPDISKIKAELPWTESSVAGLARQLVERGFVSHEQEFLSIESLVESGLSAMIGGYEHIERVDGRSNHQRCYVKDGGSVWIGGYWSVMDGDMFEMCKLTELPLDAARLFAWVLNRHPQVAPPHTIWNDWLNYYQPGAADGNNDDWIEPENYDASKDTKLQEIREIMRSNPWLFCHETPPVDVEKVIASMPAALAEACRCLLATMECEPCNGEPLLATCWESQDAICHCLDYIYHCECTGQVDTSQCEPFSIESTEVDVLMRDLNHINRQYEAIHKFISYPWKSKSNPT